jgi:cytochrome c peroxidase
LTTFTRKNHFTLIRQPIMPQLLRIAVSDALSYNPQTNSGGATANFNFSKFKKLKINAGLAKAWKIIQETKEDGNHVTEVLSHADLIQIGGAAAVEYCGGPYIELKVGRVDVHDEHSVPDETSFPHPDMNISEIRGKYSLQGFNDMQIAALFGIRTLGFLSNKDDNKEERWTRNPWVFDNNYYEELITKDSPYLKTPSDIALLNDDSLRKFVNDFANDQKLFFEAFVSTYQKLSELGTQNLLGENKRYLEI